MIVFTVLYWIVLQVRCCAMSGDGQTIVSGSDDKTVRVWDTVTGQLRHTLKGHTSSVRDHRLHFFLFIRSLLRNSHLIVSDLCG